MAKVNSEQIWGVLLELKEDVGEVKGDVKEIRTMSEYQENHLRNLNGQVEKQNTRIGDCEVKIAELETKNNPGMGESSWLKDKIISLGSGYIGAILTICAILGAIYGLGCIFNWWN